MYSILSFGDLHIYALKVGETEYMNEYFGRTIVCQNIRLFLFMYLV